EFARQRKLPLAVRSGGHSFLGWSTCDKGLVIDLSRMKGISVDPNNRIAKAGAGVLAQELVLAASQYGLVPILFNKRGTCSVSIANSWPTLPTKCRRLHISFRPVRAC